MQIQKYESLFSLYKGQSTASVFAHFHPDKDPLTEALDFDAPFKKIAAKTLEAAEAWEFTNPKLRDSHRSRPPKLRNYLNYTFVRLRELEIASPGKFFQLSADGRSCCFNTGLQDKHAADLFSIFAKYQPPALNVSQGGLRLGIPRDGHLA